MFINKYLQKTFTVFAQFPNVNYGWIWNIFCMD